MRIVIAKVGWLVSVGIGPIVVFGIKRIYDPDVWTISAMAISRRDRRVETETETEPKTVKRGK